MILSTTTKWRGMVRVGVGVGEPQQIHLAMIYTYIQLEPKNEKMGGV
jgi:hypothetical protein